jgi:DKNYY family
VLSEGYARNTDYGYYWGTPLRSCTSPLSLKVVHRIGKPEPIYARDDQHIYYEGGALKDTDLATWKPLSLGFSRDAERVYHGSQRLPGAKADSWRLLERAYSRDAKNVYVMHFRLKDCDPKHWKIVGGSYSADGKNFYYVGRLISDADAATFKVDKKGKASDKHGAFSGYSRQG